MKLISPVVFKNGIDTQDFDLCHWEGCISYDNDEILLLLCSSFTVFKTCSYIYMLGIAGRHNSPSDVNLIYALLYNERT